MRALLLVAICLICVVLSGIGAYLYEKKKGSSSAPTGIAVPTAPIASVAPETTTTLVVAPAETTTTLPLAPAIVAPSSPSYVTICNKYTNQCLENQSGSNTVTAFPADNGDDQMWIYDPTKLTICNKLTTQCLENGGGSSQGNTVAAFNDDGNQNKQWHYDATKFTICNALTNQCIENGGGASQGNTVAAYPDDGVSNKQWTMAKSVPATYTFAQGMDSGGNDLSQEASLASNIPGLESWCTGNTACKGFNTNGYMKSAILPSSGWTHWTTDPTQGLYVKN